MRTWTSHPAGTYLVQGDAAGVDVWSSIRLPFQPTGIARALRDDIQAALTGIAAVDGRILRATYAAAPFAGVVDPENVLFYNVGGRSLSALSRAGIAFERSYAIPEPPLPIDAPRGMHHHRYEMTDPDDGPVHWSLGTRLASFDDVPVARVDKPGPIWAGIRRAASLPQFSEPDTGPLVVELMVSAPGRRLRSASTVLKTLLDGAISAFHAHSGAISSDLAARAAAACGVPGMDPAALSDVGWAALGSRAVLIRPFGPEGVQWNPADERCVATSVRLQGSAADRTRWLVSGRISAALPRP